LKIFEGISFFSTFENLAYYFDTRLQYIPLTFILGFFVDTIVSRWSDIFDNMGEDEPSRWLRRSLVRYLCLTQVLVFRDISVPVRRRFPTLESLIDAGILLEEEKEKLDAIKLRYNKYWAPIRWIQAIALQARKEEKIYADLMYSKLCDVRAFHGQISLEINRFRYSLQLLCNYDWVPLPLVYSQVSFLLVIWH
uniref:Bestrophin homolog n=1 Tax=Gongylonema pulchrum TaxID=637853 RepID=A0A183E4I4_9BILA